MLFFPRLFLCRKLSRTSPAARIHKPHRLRQRHADTIDGPGKQPDHDRKMTEIRGGKH